MKAGGGEGRTNLVKVGPGVRGKPIQDLRVGPDALNGDILGLLVQGIKLLALDDMDIGIPPCRKHGGASSTGLGVPNTWSGDEMSEGGATGRQVLLQGGGDGIDVGEGVFVEEAGGQVGIGAGRAVVKVLVPPRLVGVEHFGHGDDGDVGVGELGLRFLDGGVDGGVDFGLVGGARQGDEAHDSAEEVRGPGEVCVADVVGEEEVGAEPRVAPGGELGEDEGLVFVELRGVGDGEEGEGEVHDGGARDRFESYGGDDAKGRASALYTASLLDWRWYLR